MCAVLFKAVIYSKYSPHCQQIVEREQDQMQCMMSYLRPALHRVHQVPRSEAGLEENL